MKFASKLSAHLTPEWRKQYIDYDALKEFLLTYADKKARESKEWDAEFISFIDNQDKDFFYLCEVQLQKVDSFFAEKLASVKRRFLELLEEVDHQSALESSKYFTLKSSSSRRHHESLHHSPIEHKEIVKKDDTEGLGLDNLVLERSYASEMDSQSRRRCSQPFVDGSKIRMHKRPEKTYKKLQDLKLAFSEFYLNLVLLQNYQVLNFTGFRKILKKHDKLFRRDTGAVWRMANVDEAEFNTNRDIDELIAKVEDIYTDKLEHGDRSKTMKRLRVPPLSERHNPKAVFRFGFFAGVFLVQLVVITLTYTFLHSLPRNYVPALRIFRSTFLLILFLCLFGLNTYVWRTSGVNHVLIFEINPRSHLDHYQLLEGRIVSAPFYEVKFADFWLADQLNSMNFLFPEIAFFICFYTSQIAWMDGMKYVPTTSNFNLTVPSCASNINPVIAESCECSGIMFGIEPILRVLPAWFRFAQCLRRYRDMKEKRLSPHIINAGKYSTSFFLTASSVWFRLDPRTIALVFFLLTNILHSVYTYSWDIRMDWGLLECESPNRLLREEMVYHRHTYYYAAIVENFILRFAWVIRISLQETIVPPTEFIITISRCAEVIRRFIWNFFRLENEHLNNCGEFRAVRDILIRPERRDYNTNTFNSLAHINGPRREIQKDVDRLRMAAYANSERFDTEFRNTPAQRIWNWLSKKALGHIRRRHVDHTAITGVELIQNAPASEFCTWSQTSCGKITAEHVRENSFRRSTDDALDDMYDKSLKSEPNTQGDSTRKNAFSLLTRSTLNLNPPEHSSPTSDTNHSHSRANLTSITLTRRACKRSTSPSPEVEYSSSSSDPEVTSVHRTTNTVTLLYQDPEKGLIVTNRWGKPAPTSCCLLNSGTSKPRDRAEVGGRASPNTQSDQDLHWGQNTTEPMVSSGHRDGEKADKVMLTTVPDYDNLGCDNQ
ncbi:unnamed protein product [Dicrocoelium dendriticum]|nr:unnamed protein product [Dicrocoelium dendriticum]